MKISVLIVTVLAVLCAPPIIVYHLGLQIGKARKSPDPILCPANVSQRVKKRKNRQLIRAAGLRMFSGLPFGRCFCRNP